MVQTIIKLLRNFISMFGLILIFPILVIVGLFIIVEDGFPIFFKQDRIGKGGKKFKIIKIRTLKKDTPNLGTHDLEKNHILVNGKWIIFRAILSGISDNIQPDYAAERYVGRPDNVYVYQGTSREINFTFQIYHIFPLVMEEEPILVVILIIMMKMVNIIYRRHMISILIILTNFIHRKINLKPILEVQ